MLFSSIPKFISGVLLSIYYFYILQAINLKYIITLLWYNCQTTKSTTTMSMGDEEDRKLFVGGLPQDTTQDELKVPVTFRLVFESGFRGVLDLDPGSLFN